MEYAVLVQAIEDGYNPVSCHLGRSFTLRADGTPLGECIQVRTKGLPLVFESGSYNWDDVNIVFETAPIPKGFTFPAYVISNGDDVHEMFDGWLLAALSPHSGDFLCGDCASNEALEHGNDDGFEQLMLAPPLKGEGHWHCDQCGSRDFD